MDVASSSLVSPDLVALIRQRELAVTRIEDRPRIASQLQDDILQPLLDEQLRECLSVFAQLVQPAGSRIVGPNGLDPALAYQVFESLPVLSGDRPQAERLVCDEFRRLAAIPGLEIPGAALTLGPDRNVTLRPVAAPGGRPWF